jgi:hypothetical protein
VCIRAKSWGYSFVDQSVGDGGWYFRKGVRDGNNQAVGQIRAVFDDAAAGPASNQRAIGVELGSQREGPKVTKRNPGSVPLVESEDGLGG